MDCDRSDITGPTLSPAISLGLGSTPHILHILIVFLIQDRPLTIPQWCCSIIERAYNTATR